MSGGFVHSVVGGDCIGSIAFAHGHFWQTVWDHADNAELKQLRENPNILAEGDKVFVPALREKKESGATEARHKFKRKGVPSKISIQFMKDGKVRAGLPWVFKSGLVERQGQTDGQGFARLPIMPDVHDGVLTITENGQTEEYVVDVGTLDPVSTLRGVQQRLANMGFGVNSSGVADEETEAAVAEFRQREGMEAGGLDDAFRDKLKERHGV